MVIAGQPSVGIAKYRPEIDGLRALAILLVIGFHAAPSIVTAGFIGVDVFFAISGYLITGVILQALDERRFSLTDFYLYRCRRLFPALFTMLAALWALSWLVLLPDEFDSFGKAMKAAVTFSENMLLVRQAGYFDAQAIQKPLLHLWSLAIEEQFYIFWPLLLWLAVRLRLVLPLIVLTLAASFACAYVNFTTNPLAEFYLLPSRFWEIASGAVLFVLERRYGRRCFPGQSLVALFILILFAFLMNPYLLFPGWAVPACVTALLLLSAGANDPLNQRLFAHPLAVYIGRISYPLYLWHWPLLSLAHITEGMEPSPAIRSGAVLLSFVLAALTYHWVELPIRRNFFQKTNVRAGLLLTAIALALLGSVTHHHPEWLRPQRNWLTSLPQGMEAASLEQVMNTHWWEEHHEDKDEACLHSEWSDDAQFDYCRLTKPIPHVAILGDSHANHLVPGLASLGDPTLSAVVQRSFGGCSLFDQVLIYQREWPTALFERCYNGNQLFFDKVLADKQIQTVIISLFANREEAGHYRIEVRGGDYASLSGKELLRVGLSHMIGRLEANGKHVVFFIDIPNLGFDPRRCFNVRRFSLSSDKLSRCERPLSEVLAAQQDQRQLAEALKQEHPALQLFDPIPVLCDKQFCYARRDGKMLYRDSNHLSRDGSIVMGEALAAAIAH